MPRVRLEPPSLRRAAEFLEAVRRSRALHRPWVRPPATLERYRAFVRRARRENHLCHLVIAESDALAGVIEISEIVGGPFRSGYLGYYAFEPFAGRGYMRAAVALAVGMAFRRCGLHRVEANIQPANARSIALARGLGFRREGYSPRYLKMGGRWRDHERYAITAEEWRAAGRSASRAIQRAGPANSTARRPGGAGTARR